jgi:hypothetical protein
MDGQVTQLTSVPFELRPLEPPNNALTLEDYG